jgi:hypothetical protein
MNNIFATTRPVEFVPMQTDLRNWRFLGMEMEALGTRLDAARESLARAKTDWARWYWTETLDRLMLQWRSMPILHDADVTMTLVPRWMVNYEWWDGTAEIGGWDISDQLFDKIFRTDDLDSVWRRHRDARLMKCNCQ